MSKAGGLNSSDTTGIVLAAIPSTVTAAKPGIVCLTWADPLDTATAEYITYTSIDAGTKELQGVTRGAEDFSAKTHDNGCTVAWVVSRSHVNNVNDLLTGVTEGIKVKTSIQDVNGNEVIKTPATASAVNEHTITNAATGNNPTISATGGDTNIGLDFQTKGTGVYNLKGTADTAAEIRLFEDTDNGTNYTGIKGASSQAGNVTYTLPSADGTSGYQLTTNGSGTLSWAAPGSLTSHTIQFTRDIAGSNGDVSYTGIGFIPTSIIFSYMTTDGKCVGTGMVDSAKNMVSYFSAQQAGYTTGDSATDKCIYFSNASGTNQQALLKTYDADGFTLTWNKTSTPTGTGHIIAICYK